jgi:hypothetical protein
MQRCFHFECNTPLLSLLVRMYHRNEYLCDVYTSHMQHPDYACYHAYWNDMVLYIGGVVVCQSNFVSGVFTWIFREQDSGKETC